MSWTTISKRRGSQGEQKVTERRSTLAELTKTETSWQEERCSEERKVVNWSNGEAELAINQRSLTGACEPFF